jgi:hypothetical protein
MTAQPPTPIDYQTVKPSTRAAWRWPLLILVVLLIAGTRFCLIPLLTDDWFPVPSDPPLIQPMTGFPTTAGSGTPATGASE